MRLGFGFVVGDRSGDAHFDKEEVFQNFCFEVGVEFCKKWRHIEGFV